MPNSTKTEREVYEAYLIRQARDRGEDLQNIVDPMGGREEIYQSMIAEVLRNFNF